MNHSYIETLKAKLAEEKESAEKTQRQKLEAEKREREERAIELERWQRVDQALQGAVARFNEEFDAIGISATCSEAIKNYVAPLEVELEKSWLDGRAVATFSKKENEVVVWISGNVGYTSITRREVVVIPFWQADEEHLFYGITSAVERMP